MRLPIFAFLDHCDHCERKRMAVFNQRFSTESRLLLWVKILSKWQLNDRDALYITCREKRLLTAYSEKKLRSLLTDCPDGNNSNGEIRILVFLYELRSAVKKKEREDR